MYYITINVQYVRYSTGRKIKYFIVYRLDFFYLVVGVGKEPVFKRGLLMDACGLHTRQTVRKPTEAGVIKMAEFLNRRKKLVI